ncbi:hypothetical protein AKJ16_DCAP10350 [Drosera capensis]
MALLFNYVSFQVFKDSIYGSDTRYQLITESLVESSLGDKFSQSKRQSLYTLANLSKTKNLNPWADPSPDSAIASVLQWRLSRPWGKPTDGGSDLVRTIPNKERRENSRFSRNNFEELFEFIGTNVDPNSSGGCVCDELKVLFNLCLFDEVEYLLVIYSACLLTEMMMIMHIRRGQITTNWSSLDVIDKRLIADASYLGSVASSSSQSCFSINTHEAEKKRQFIKGLNWRLKTNLTSQKGHKSNVCPKKGNTYENTTGGSTDEDGVVASGNVVVAGMKPKNPLDRKMKFSFVELACKDGRMIFKPSGEAIIETMSKWGNYLIGYFIFGKLPMLTVERIAKSAWSKLGLDCEIKDTQGKAMQWTPQLVMCKKAHDKVPLWVTIRNIPLALWMSSALSGIASLIGKPLYTDSFKENMIKIAFVRICIKVCADKALLDEVYVKLGNSVLPLKVDYQWKPPSTATATVTAPVENKGKNIVVDSTPIDDEGFILVRKKKKPEFAMGAAPTKGNSSTSQLREDNVLD